MPKKKPGSKQARRKRVAIPNLQHLDRLASIGTLAAGMAHEIKNALVAGKTFIDLLLEKNQDNELTQIVRREIGRIDSIVNQMLRFASPAPPSFCSVRLHEILDHSLRLIQHRLEGNSIFLKREYAATSDLIRGDDRQLAQAFVNLFLNALEAMGPEGTLTVATEVLSADSVSSHSRTQSNGQRVRVSISDTGSGISTANIKRLWEPFFTTKSNGTGLGLTITRRIMLDHRGAIDVQSAPNHGTAFHLLFPTENKNG